MSESSRKMNGLRLVVKGAICVVIAAAGYQVVSHYMSNKPMAKSRKTAALTPVVKTQLGQRETLQTQVEGMGTVIPRDQVSLRPQVRGRVLEVHPNFMEGGQLKAGEVVVRLEAVDYELAVATAEANLAKAKTDLQLEQGQQEVAKREWEMLGLSEEEITETDRLLALRKPQLAAAQAAIKAAEVSLQKAQLDLARTVVKMPFNGQILNRGINLGEIAETSTILAEIAGTDIYQVQTLLAVDKLAWVNFPPQASQAKLVTSDGREFPGQVSGRLADLQENGRMARVLVDIQTPTVGEQPLLINEFVSVKIAGKPLEGVVSLPAYAFNNNKEVWVLNEKSCLDILEVEPVWSDRTTHYFDDERLNNQKLILSALGFPVQGMKLKEKGK